ALIVLLLTPIVAGNDGSHRSIVTGIAVVTRLVENVASLLKLFARVLAVQRRRPFRPRADAALTVLAIVTGDAGPREGAVARIVVLIRLIVDAARLLNLAAGIIVVMQWYDGLFDGVRLGVLVRASRLWNVFPARRLAVARSLRNLI